MAVFTFFFEILGVGLGVALAKHQQFMLEQHLAKLDVKPKRRVGAFGQQSTDDSNSQAMVLHENSSVVSGKQKASAPAERKFL
jgi:hypothetical protein